MRITLAVPADFEFETAVASHGFFALAPNQWDARGMSLTTVLTMGNESIRVTVKPSPPSGKPAVRILAPGQIRLGQAHRSHIRRGISRMLRLDEDLSPFHCMCAADPRLESVATSRFGRLLRSPSLFEDIVKTMCTCNITWRQTLGIVQRLVDQYGTPALNDPSSRAFPSPQQLASVGEARLRTTCSLGYRAEWVARLAKEVVEGRFDLEACDQSSLDSDELHRHLRSIHGVGDYAASTLCMLLGRYDRLAVDSETVKHYKLQFPRRKVTPTLVRKHYERHQPFPYLVYWWEMWNRYRDETGQATSWSKE